jgi:hypothetical protein
MLRTTGNRPHKDHRFPGGYDSSLWQKALDVRTERLTATRIRVVLEPRDVTHAVPTGDLFRRLAVHVIPDNTETNPPIVIYLARHFDRAGGMREVSDNRIFNHANILTLDVPPGEIIIRVDYERVGNHRSPDEHDAEIENSVLVRELRLRR